jgi:putative transposase
MLWARLLAYVTGTVDQELLLRNEYLATENRILRGQIKGRLLLSEGEKATLAEIAHRLGRTALEDVAATAKPVAGELLFRQPSPTENAIRRECL